MDIMIKGRKSQLATTVRNAELDILGSSDPGWHLDVTNGRSRSGSVDWFSSLVLALLSTSA